MANKGDIYKVALPNGDEYNFKDKYVRENYRALNNNDFDTINVTELNSGNIINTGAARFLNTINGSISGNAATADDAAKLNGYASDTSATNNTIARRTANGYLFATYFNQSSGAETPTSNSYIIYANSDGYFRKSTVANMKTAMSLNDVENKSSATIRGELTSANVTTALGFTPVNKAGDTMSGTLKWNSTSLPQKASTAYAVVIDAFADGGEMGWRELGSNAFNSTAFLPLSGGTLTGRVAYKNVAMPLSAGKVTSLAAGTTEIFKDGIAISNPATSNDVGWMRVIGTGESDTVLEIATGDDGGGTTAETIVVRQYNTSNAIAHEAKLLDPSGNTSFPGNVTAPKFIGNLQGTADNADKVDGYHIYYDRYVSSTQLAQPTADTIWYVKVSTANWNSNIEVIQIRTGGNNRTGSHVLYTGSRGTKWWGYGQVYSHRGLSGVYKVISNSDDVYLRFDADCTAATIYTSFTPQTVAIVDNPSGANYTEVPTYGGWYGNQITVDHIQTNNYITIQKQTVASNTFADSNPKIVFKNVDGSQNGSLTWTDYDSVQSPASLTLNGNHGGEYFIAPNIKATGSFYGTLSGTASHSNALNLIASNEIRFGNRPSSAVDVYFNYQWADGTASAMINKYVFMNGNKTKCPVEASKFIGPLQGNADTATKATQDSDGNVINSTYLKLSGGTLTGTLYLGSSTQSTLPTCGIFVHDVRSVAITPTCLNRSVNFFFTNKSTDRPSTEGWSSIMHVQGWNGTENYNSWELLGPAGTGDQRTSPLYVRSSNEGTWGDWRKIYDTSNKPSKSDVGLGNVDNTADANKSVNYATSAGSANTATSSTDSNYLVTPDGRAASADIDLSNAKRNSKMFWCLASSSMTTSSPGEGYITTWSWDWGGYGAQLFMPQNPTQSAKRRGSYVSGTSDWGNWITLLDSNNYTTYTVTKTGTGASGTWGISISGNAATATSATSATTATKDSSGAVIKDTYVKKAGDSMTGTLCMNSTNGNYGEGIRINAGNGGFSSFTLGTAANSTSGISDCGFWIGTNITNATHQRKLYIAHNSSTASGTYFYASSATQYSPNLRIGSDLLVVGTTYVNASCSGTSAGIALYGTSAPTSYGITMRGTATSSGQLGKHGYVQGDWAGYLCFDGAVNRGYIFRQAGNNIASISGEGHAVFNGSVTVGGNATNTSGVRQVYNSTTQSLDFVFVA